MYCYKCGKEIPDEAVYCSSCGTNLKSTTDEPQMSSEAEKNTVEEMLMNGLCNRVINHMWVQNGDAILTNKRFIYLKRRILKEALINLANLENGGFIPVDEYEFEIPIDDIISIEDGRQGISKTIILNTKNGEKYNFYFTRRNEWKNVFENLINR